MKTAPETLAEVITKAVGVFIAIYLLLVDIYSQRFATLFGYFRGLSSEEKINSVTMSPPTQVSAVKLCKTTQREIENKLSQTPYLALSNDSVTSELCTITPESAKSSSRCFAVKQGF